MLFERVFSGRGRRLDGKFRASTDDATDWTPKNLNKVWVLEEAGWKSSVKTLNQEEFLSPPS
jgi:hypothetical protein